MDIMEEDLPNIYQNLNLSFKLNYVQADSSIGIKVENTVVKQMIEFSVISIDNEVSTYQAEEGMTWEEWVESEYNVDKYKKYYDNIVSNISLYLCYDDVWFSDNYVYFSSVIENERKYYIRRSNQGGAID